MTNLTASAAHETIVRSLELIAESAGDINPKILERYFARCPAAAELMDHMDNYMVGRMLDQVLLLIMESDDTELESYLRFETASHNSYGVQSHMYEQLFQAVLEVASESAGEHWQADFQQAWQQRLDTLLARIVAADSAYVAEQAAS
jgi:hypothetical protein